MRAVHRFCVILYIGDSILNRFPLYIFRRVAYTINSDRMLRQRIDSGREIVRQSSTAVFG